MSNSKLAFILFLSLLISLFSSLLFSISAFAQTQTETEETLTFTTYYPAPYGVYNELSANILNVGLPAGTTTGIIRFRGGAANPATTQEGTLYYNTNARNFRYWDNNSWQDLGGAVGAEQYVIWGDTSCASGYTALYTGYMYQGGQASGYGGDIVCSTGVRKNIYVINAAVSDYEWEVARPCAVCAKSSARFCYTKWGDTACASGFTATYTGYMFQGGQASGLGGGILCSAGVRKNIYVINAAVSDYEWEVARPCALCCSN